MGFLAENGVKSMEMGSVEQVILSPKSQNVCDDLTLGVGQLLKKVEENPDFQLTAQVKREFSNNFFMNHSGIRKDVKEVSDFDIGSLNDDHRIKVRLYSPHETRLEALIMCIHGGGWMQGNLDTHDCLCREMSETLNAETIAVDYRLAPENIFPTPLNDVFSAYMWCRENYQGRDIIIAGDSAGGNLAAALCVKLHSEKRYAEKPSAQILFYPSLSNNFESKSFGKFANVAALSKIGTIMFTSQYAGVGFDAVGSLNNKLIYPLQEDDVTAFPKTVIVSADCDVLLEEQEEFAAKLRNGGISVEHIVADGTVHGFMTYGREFQEEITDVLFRVKRLIP
jgi:acetyl esterase